VKGLGLGSLGAHIREVCEPQGADKRTARSCVDCRNELVSHRRKGLAKVRVREGDGKVGP
jgi:hypothetical protein